MSKEQLNTMLGKNIEILFNNGTVERGKLECTSIAKAYEPGCKSPIYTINELLFRASHVKAARVLM